MVVWWVLAIIFCVSEARLKGHFSRFDRDGDGELNLFEVQSCSCLPLFEKSFEIEECVNRVDPAQVDTVMALLDFDLSGSISYEEFQITLPEQVRSPIEKAPQQVHLAATTSPSEMVVMWVTRDHDASVVQYGKDPQSLSLSENGTSATYNVGMDGWRGWVHKVTLTGLDANSLYYYVVGQSDNQSIQFHFRTPSVPVSPDATVSFAIVADMGTTIPMGWYVTDRIVEAHKKKPFSMVIHAGDICYAGTGGTDELEEVWDIWGDQVQPWLPTCLICLLSETMNTIMIILHSILDSLCLVLKVEAMATSGIQ
eukprot:TRINITY_DN3940_c0_g1_i2.p1 TRINITY_DN3940_c0_g1~~TRINITY_DN3940_c0_g1_i2.p1  ORF type:complete len:311 (+),score=41.75 TRINITY_DN3940_c0_g1_i2:2-934(+)